MAKKETKKMKSSLTVVSTDGRQPFLRGIVTHDLMQRGLEFDDAYAVAHAVRASLADREEIDSEELWDRILQQVESSLGVDLSRRVATPVDASQIDSLTVIYNGRPVPFSRGLLARSLSAAGLDLDDAYRYVMDLEADLRGADSVSISSEDLALRVIELLRRAEGKDVAERYRLIRRLRHLPKPMVIYLGGAAGTGKSTLSLDLAPVLRIYRVVATDTIRQVMRMMVSPEILPAIHDSSFAARHLVFGADDPGDDPVQEAIDAFQEQALRICVGVRGMVERAVAEGQNVLVEGVHVVPPIVPFADLEGACYQLPLMLATPDAEEHRRRFFLRARRGRRPAERYIESFETIRALHDFMLEQAEQEDVPLINTGSGSGTRESVQVITTLLRRRLPKRALQETGPAQPVTPVLLVIIDGLADRPVRALGGRTPLQVASTPTLDRLAREGRTGLADAIAPGVVPDTAAGSLALLGQSPAALSRGPVEALGADLEPQIYDIALRANLATFDERGVVVDRRAGRIREDAVELAKALNQIVLPARYEGVEIQVRPATEHRLAILLRGQGLSPAISGSDPGDGSTPCPPLVPSPEDPKSSRAATTARLLAVFETEARRVLAEHPLNLKRVKAGQPPANGILTRGAGRIHRLEPLQEAGEALSLCCVGGDRTVLGLARWLGAEIIHEEGMTANLDTDLDLKIDRVETALHKHDLVILHLKGADIAAHDRRPDLKVAFLESVDQALSRLLKRREEPLRVAVSGDHATLSESGQHAADPLPVLIWGTGIEADSSTEFHESAAVLGELGRFPLQTLMGRLFHLD